ncbi:metallophosphoesterase family protein [candidate division KSB1 bacterium]|nr:metallophosphoesterase family protein [candidate division KSB1 bacterium]NIR69808.1 metallophosphoesterase family protein [candidate division KSB1 bacterium]NIS25798.1 metallophosphoesterase family protein [candidate division KSB1 bacterium]NIT72672.1 metallophosphoesterase family protein [candidate division KSB1 bacterium]NIU26487.1 metallophosphoesterase family protein [candidate division KSB1 bacterium]
MQNIDCEKIAIFGGVYNNYLALEALVADARKRGVERFFCLGDLGAFGPNPNKVFPILLENDIAVVQGNYDHSIGNDLSDCQCGYTDPQDNYFAQISYDYTYRHVDSEFKKWQKTLPPELRMTLDGKDILMCHGSPRKTNEFLWESTTPTHFLEKLCQDFDADIILATHTGIHWKRHLQDGKFFANVGVIGRPENDGKTNVWYAILSQNGGVSLDFIPLQYDYKKLASEMQDEDLPQEFIDTILTGWWTTCLEILPAKERAQGKF